MLAADSQESLEGRKATYMFNFHVRIENSVYGLISTSVRPLSSRTERSRLVMHHCRKSSFLSVLSALLVLFRCACVSSLF